MEKQIDSGLIDVIKKDIVKRLLDEVPNQPSEEELAADPHLHRFVIVFDREGYSPDFFEYLWDERRIGCLTRLGLYVFWMSPYALTQIRPPPGCSEAAS